MPVDLVVQQSASDGALVRMAFQVPSLVELDKSLERLAQLGIEPTRTSSNRARRGFVIPDPDGLEIEFFAFSQAEIAEPQAMAD